MKLNINWKQPSTQRGAAVLAAGLLQMFGQDVSVDTVQTAVGALLSIAGIIGIMRSDPSTESAAAPPSLTTTDRWSRDP